MSANALENVLLTVIMIQGRPMQMLDMETSTTINIKIAPSNYFRNMETVEDSVIEGREFIVAKKHLDAASFPTLERGQRIIDPDFGTETISSIREMIALGKIIGYRIRTS